MILSIIALLGGIIAASPVIIAKKPNAKELIDKITPYQGWIGVLLAVLGLIGIIQMILHLSAFSLVWLIGLASSVVQFVVGFLLGYGLISQYLLNKNETAKQKGQQLRLKLMKYQIPTGFILIVLAVLSLVL
ncbi:hypothetical protein MG290_09830 [Flavobacterium sp. CBA20B-1]|uniref:hypothetical protein n=1 Tax=unclassified Flavobacterium TaxID=196869 RepID=UPI0022244A7D|nr:MULTISPECIES: hypothetical protein [unclassified Flavobacterium]WCM41256.1 hypothetical protein MG290_09830 [Flavobacterium sp. CBA20B-1]